MRKLIASVCFGLALLGSASGQCESTPPGLRYPLWDWRFFNINGGTLPQTIGYYFKEDTLVITIENGNRLGLTPNEIEIVLISQNDWRKEIGVFSACAGRGPIIFTSGSNRGPVTMRLNRTDGSADTVLLRKDKLFQGMVDMYHFDLNYFWKMWAGKIITFNWVQDNVWFGNYPPACDFPCIPLDTTPSDGELYDADGKADVGVWRPSSGEWFVINSSTSAGAVKQFGLNGDRPVPFDYDFDGTIDMAVWRPSTGQWWIRNSFTGATRVATLGSSNDIPVPGDYDRDGKTDLAVWRPSLRKWRINFFANVYQPSANVTIGDPGDIAVPGDYDGDGFWDVAVWKPFTGNWKIVDWFSGETVKIQQWGLQGDIPVPADYDGDGKTDFAIWRPSGTFWDIINSSTGAMRLESFGTPFEEPVARDFDGDGKADLAMWNPATGVWRIRESSTGGQERTVAWGTNGDVLVPAK